MTADLGRAILDEARERLVKGLPAQVVECLDLLDEEQIWWRPNEASNSVGNLVLHVCGSSRHFIGRALGGSGYTRDRAAEFAARGPVPRDTLKALVAGTAEETGRVLDALDPGRLLEMNDRAGEAFTVLALVQRTSHHWTLHTGQIVYATKMMKAGAVHELWYKTMGPAVGGKKV